MCPPPYASHDIVEHRSGPSALITDDRMSVGRIVVATIIIYVTWVTMQVIQRTLEKCLAYIMLMYALTSHSPMENSTRGLTVRKTSSLVMCQRPIAHRPILGIAHSQWAASGPPSQWPHPAAPAGRVHTITRAGRAGQLAVMGRPADQVLNGLVQPRCLLAI